MFIERPVVFGLLPLLSFPVPGGTAPGLKEIAFLIQFDHRRCWHAALGRRRVQDLSHLTFIDGFRSVNQPDMIITADRDAGDLAEDHIIGQGPGPAGIHFVTWG